MYHWFQNLNKAGTRLAHFRGSVGNSYYKNFLSYELCTGPSLRFMLEPEKDLTKVSLGFLFFTLYLKIHGLVLPLITKNRQYGFYVYDYAIWIFFGERQLESRQSDPWYYCMVVRPLDILFGKTIYFKEVVLESLSPRYFMFRGKEYKADGIKIVRGNWFKPRIPFSLYSVKRLGLELAIENPPKYAGKGESGYDCEDNASYGISCLYSGPIPTWKDREDVFKWCCYKYCEEVSEKILRYGRSAGDSLPPNNIDFAYLGSKSSGESYVVIDRCD